MNILTWFVIILWGVALSWLIWKEVRISVWLISKLKNSYKFCKTKEDCEKVLEVEINQVDEFFDKIRNPNINIKNQQEKADVDLVKSVVDLIDSGDDIKTKQKKLDDLIHERTKIFMSQWDKK